MEHVINVLLLFVGFIFLVKGADFFVASSASIARRFKISSLVIGLTTQSRSPHPLQVAG